MELISGRAGSRSPTCSGEPEHTLHAPPTTHTHKPNSYQKHKQCWGTQPGAETCARKHRPPQRASSRFVGAVPPEAGELTAFNKQPAPRCTPLSTGEEGVHAEASWDSWRPGKNQEAGRAQGTHLRNHHSAAKNRLQFHSSGLWWQKPSSNELNIPNGEFTGP